MTTDGGVIEAIDDDGTVPVIWPINPASGSWATAPAVESRAKFSAVCRDGFVISDDCHWHWLEGCQDVVVAPLTSSPNGESRL